MTQKAFTPDALRRVEVRQGQSPDIYIDPTGSKDTAHVTAPADYTPEEVHSLTVKGAVMAALEGFRRYRRSVTRRFGMVREQEALFDTAYDKALYELQQLIHHLPASVSLPELEGVSMFMGKPVSMEDQLPDNFFRRAILRSEGINTLQGLADVSDEMLSLVFTPEDVAQIRSEAAFLLRPALQGSALEPTDQLPNFEQGWTDLPQPDAGVSLPAPAPDVPPTSYPDDWYGSQQQRQQSPQLSPEEVQMLTPVKPEASQPAITGQGQHSASYVTEVKWKSGDGLPPAETPASSEVEALTASDDAEWSALQQANDQP